MARSRRLEIVIAGDAKSAVAALNKTEGATNKTAGVFGRLTKAAGAVGLALAAKNLVGDAFEGLKRSEAATAQLEAGLLSTGNAANTTVTGMSAYADSLEAVTGTEAELIMEGQALLQTFTNVRNEAGAGNDVFNRATEAAVDLAAKGFGSVTDASKMLGKALNDPVKGITALGRAGVTFSDDQKQMIQTLVDTGDTLGAQKVILDEVTKQVGGAAAAYGETLPGKIDRANAAVGRITESLLASAAPALEAVASGITSLAVQTGLLNDVDIDLPDKLLEAGDAALSSLQDWDALSLGLSEIGEVIQGNGGIKALERYDAAWTQLVSNGNADVAAEQFARASDFARANGASMDEVYAAFPQYTLASKELADATTKTGDAQHDAAIDTEAWGSEMGLLDDEVKALTTSFDFLLGRFLTTDEAQIRSRELTRSLSEAVREGQREDETAAAFKDRLQGSLINVINQLAAEYDVMVRSGEATGGLAERNRFLNDRLMELQGTVPALSGEIRGYRDQLNSVPKGVNTTVTADTSQADVAIQAFRNRWAGLQLRVPLTVIESEIRRDAATAGRFANRFPRRQHGGPVQAGHGYVVGERRAELFWPDEDGWILPSVPTASTGRAPSQPIINYNFHIGTWLGDKAGIRDLAGRITKVQEARLRQAGRR